MTEKKVSILTDLTGSELDGKLRRRLQCGVTSMRRSGDMAEHRHGALIHQLKVQLLYNPYLMGRETRELTLSAHLWQRLAWKTHNPELKQGHNWVIFFFNFYPQLTTHPLHTHTHTQMPPTILSLSLLFLVPLKLGCGNTSWGGVSVSWMTPAESSQPWWN